MRRLISTALSAFDIRKVWGADSNAEAIDLCKDHDFDLVIVDIKLRDESGLDFVRWLRDQGVSQIPFVPVIVVSSFSGRRQINEAINAGIDEFLVKPFRPIDLARRIDAVTYNRREFIHTPSYFGPDRRRFDNPSFTGPYRRKEDREDQLIDFDV